MNNSKTVQYIGIDTGGTFTDFVIIQNNNIRIHKVLSTPKAPEAAILQGIDDLALYDTTKPTTIFIVHGSTVATNAVLEGKGVRTVYITNHGLGDILTIGRQARRELYNLQPQAEEPPVPRHLCLETGGRIAADGTVIDKLDATGLSKLRQQLDDLSPQAVAINLLFSFIDDQFEKDIAAIIPAAMFVSRSSEVLPEHKEYERGITTWLNASIGPIVKNYIDRLCAGITRRENTGTTKTNISVMQSSGGTMAATSAAKQAVHMLLSGPAGGLSAAQYVATHAGHNRLLSFDMGGTSTDVALLDGELQLTHEGHIGKYPVAVPMVDMHTIGAGGGSIAYLDAGGLLQVGPESAGADPGPACYGRDGKSATVTDANVVLGRIRPELFLGGNMQLDASASHKAIDKLARLLAMSTLDTAKGIIRIVNEHMAGALRVMSVQRGIDPQLLTLVSFGGAGGLHVCALAEALDMNQALVPAHAGVLSALGMLVAPRSRHYSRTINVALDKVDIAVLNEIYNNMIEQGQVALSDEGVTKREMCVTKSVDLRYRGQSYSLTLEWRGTGKCAGDFHRKHQQRYGHKLDLPIELVAARVKIQGAKPNIALQQNTPTNTSPPVSNIKLEDNATDVPVYERASLALDQQFDGPALVTELVSTTYIAPGWRCHADRYGNLILQR